jgi:hypothetical protein
MRTKLIGLAAVALAAGIGTHTFTAWSEEPRQGSDRHSCTMA